MQRREQEGTGVVDTGVDVEDHGDGRHDVDHGGCRAAPAPVTADGCRRVTSGDVGSPAAAQEARRIRHSERPCAITYRRPVTSPTTRHRTRRRIAVTTSGLVALALAGCSPDPAAPTSPTSAAATSATPPARSASPTASQDPAGRVRVVDVGVDEPRSSGSASCSWSGSTPTRRWSHSTISSRTDHVGNVILLGGWDGAGKVTRTTTHLRTSSRRAPPVTSG